MKIRSAALRVIMIAWAVVVVLAPMGASAASRTDLRRVVVFHEGTAVQVQRRVVADSGSRLLHLLSLIDGAAIELPATGTEAALAHLQSDPAVAGVYDDPVIGAQAEVSAIAQGAGGDGAGGDQIIYVTPVPPPTREIYPWGIDRIGAADVQEDRHLAGDGVEVAVFDTGIDRNHPDLAPNIVGGFNAIADADPSGYDDDNGHGTAIAGIIAARRNRFGVIGAAPHATLYAVKVLDRNGRGHTSDIIYALGVITSRPHIRVVNMSFGTSLYWPLFPLAVQRAVQSGKIIVASRGNGCTTGATGFTTQGVGADGAGGDGAGGDGAGGDAACTGRAVKFPAAYPEVIAVGATTRTDHVPSYSLWAGWGTVVETNTTTNCAPNCPTVQVEMHVDVVAPGGDNSSKTLEPGSTSRILTTNIGGGYGEITGTSPAAAHVTGAVALALQVRPKISAARMQDLLRETATHLACCPAAQQGAGLVNADALVETLKRSQDDED